LPSKEKINHAEERSQEYTMQKNGHQYKRRAKLKELKGEQTFTG
jgi:hypothetical protein